MEVRAIALPYGAVPKWIRVGSLLDPVFPCGPNEMVERIVRIPTGFRIQTRDAITCEVSYYEAPAPFVIRVEEWSGEYAPYPDSLTHSDSWQQLSASYPHSH